MSNNTIYIVSGIPRSGTSMMMGILEAGGLEILTDNIRFADQDNPKGYYEFEDVKQLSENKEWLQNAQGKVVKVISQLLKELPENYDYKVIFMERNMKEILASQKQMLIRRGESIDKISDSELAILFEKHLKYVKSWLLSQSNFEVLYISYNQTLKDPQSNLDKVNIFCGAALNLSDMLSVVDQSLHRQQA